MYTRPSLWTATNLAAAAAVDNKGQIAAERDVESRAVCSGALCGRAIICSSALGRISRESCKQTCRGSGVRCCGVAERPRKRGGHLHTRMSTWCMNIIRRGKQMRAVRGARRAREPRFLLLQDQPNRASAEKRSPSLRLFLCKSPMIGVTQAGAGCTVVTVDHVSIMMDCPLDVSTLLSFLPLSYSTLYDGLCVVVGLCLCILFIQSRRRRRDQSKPWPAEPVRSFVCLLW